MALIMTILKMIAMITIFSCGFMITPSTTDGEFILHTEKMTWSEAHAVCSRDGGTLISDYSQENVAELMVNLVANISTPWPLWEGRYYSPWAWLLGCYTYYGSLNYIEIKKNQMKECMNHCSNSNYFGLQGKNCLCFDNFEGKYVRTKNYCSNVCPGNKDESCGGDNALTIYMNDICYTTSTIWRGTVSRSWTGKQCLHWANVSESQGSTSVHFPDGSTENASNFCRDPLALSYLWCYVSQETKERCDIPPCIKASNEGFFRCMSFKKRRNAQFQFMQESCQSKHRAICSSETNIFAINMYGNWQHARDMVGDILGDCKSLAGPRIFWLAEDGDVNEFHWFGYSRDECTVSKTAPRQKPQKCFSLSKAKESIKLNIENCDHRNAFMCQYAPSTCGEDFNSSYNGSFVTPGYNDLVGYGAYQRCVWAIYVPENHFISLSLDVSMENTYMCGSDFLRVYEETYETGESFCGENLTTINTTGNRVTIEFRSDGTMNNFRGAQVNWFAVPVQTTMPTKPTTSKLSMTTSKMTHSSDNTTAGKFSGSGGGGNFVIAGGALAGKIAGLVVAIGLILGIVLFLVRRRKTSKYKDTRNNTAPEVKNRDASPTSRLNDSNIKDTGIRPSSEIYQNTSHDNENKPDDAQYSTVHGSAREKTVIANSFSVSYLKKDDKDDRVPRSEDPSEVYNTLNETIENHYQNRTENVYDRFDDSHFVYDHTATETSNRKNDLVAASDMQTYDHLNDDKYTYAHTSS